MMVCDVGGGWFSLSFSISQLCLSGLFAARQGNAYSPSRRKCQTENCEFYGDKKYHGYCSNCFQGNQPDIMYTNIDFASASDNFH